MSVSVKVNGKTYDGIDRVRLPLADGSGYAKFDIVDASMSIACESGGVAGASGAESVNSARIRTAYIPYRAADKTVSADVIINGVSGDASFTLVPFDSGYNYVEGFYPYSGYVTPDPSLALNGYAYIDGWSKADGTQYTLQYGAGVAFIRAIFRNSAGDDVTSISGTITVSGTEYTLEGA